MKVIRRSPYYPEDGDVFRIQGSHAVADVVASPATGGLFVVVVGEDRAACVPVQGELEIRAD